MSRTSRTCCAASASRASTRRREESETTTLTETRDVQQRGARAGVDRPVRDDPRGQRDDQGGRRAQGGAEDLRQLRTDRRVRGQRRGLGLPLEGGGDQVGQHVLAGRDRAQLTQDRRAGAAADHRAHADRDDREERPRARQPRGRRPHLRASTSGSTRSTRPRCSTTACGRCSTSWCPSRRPS